MTNLAVVATPPRRYGTRQVVRAELTKLRSLRSTFWTLGGTVVGSLLVTVLAATHVSHRPARFFQGFDATNMSLTGLALGSLVIGVLGVLAITGEYGTGTIRSSLAATPRRRLLLGAKMIVVGAVALVVGEVITFACFFTGQGILSGSAAPSASIGQPGVLRAVLLSGAFLALLALLGLGLGLIIRHTAGAIAAFVGITFILPVLLQSLAGDPQRFAPEAILANSVAAVVPQSGQLSATVGFLLMILYCVVTLAIGMTLLVRRDA
jgi:ABC-2 type transport system permease protein